MGNLALIEELERQFGDNPQRVFARLASEYRKAGDLARAIELCRTYVPQQPGYISGHIVLGQALYESGELDEAQKTFETALQLDPENLIALRQLGDIAHARGDVDGARGWYTRLLDVDPQNEDVVAQLAALDTPPPLPTAAAAATSDAGDTVRRPDVAMEQVPLDHIGAQVQEPGLPGADAPAAGSADAAAPDLAAGRQTQSDADLAALWDTGVADAAEPDAAARTRGQQDEAQASIGLESFAAIFGPGTSSDAVAEHEPLDAPLAGLTSAEESPLMDFSTPSRPAESGAEPTPPFSPLADLALPPVEIESTELDLGTADARSAGASAERDPWSAPDAPPSEPAVEAGFPWDSTSQPAEGDSAASRESPFAAFGGADEPADGRADKPPERWSPFEERDTDAVAASGAPPASPEADMPDAFLTETMAELYVQQGLLRKAVGVYEHLVVSRPGDERLRARLSDLQEELALADASSGPDEDEQALAELENGASSFETALDDVTSAGAAGRPDDTPYAMPAAEAHAPGREAREPIARDANAAPAAPAVPYPTTRRPTVRAFFSALGARRAGGDTPRESTPVRGEAAAVPHDEGTNGRAADDADEQLPDARDVGLERASGATPADAASRHDLPGVPSRAAPSALSLDEVFRDTMGRPPRPGSHPESLDEFFSESQEGDAGGGAPSGAGPPPSAAADLEAFNAWLEGLKK